jgi:hypothetical protein
MKFGTAAIRIRIRDYRDGAVSGLELERFRWNDVWKRSRGDPLTIAIHRHPFHHPLLG